DGEVCVITANAGPLVESLPGSLGARVLVAKCDMPVDVVADCLDAPHPVGELPNSCQAVSDRRSVSQYRLPNRNSRVSSGSSSTGVCLATETTTSGCPVSFTSASVDNLTRPLGATIRLHQLPKLSR